MLWLSRSSDHFLSETFRTTAPPSVSPQSEDPHAASSTCVMSIRVEVTVVEARVYVVLIQSPSFSQEDLRMVYPKSITILHLSLPGHVNQLNLINTKLKIRDIKTIKQRFVSRPTTNICVNPRKQRNKTIFHIFNLTTASVFVLFCPWSTCWRNADGRLRV